MPQPSESGRSEVGDTRTFGLAVGRSQVQILSPERPGSRRLLFASAPPVANGMVRTGSLETRLSLDAGSVCLVDRAFLW